VDGLLVARDLTAVNERVGWVCDVVLLWVAKIRVLGTRNLREVWDAGFGGVVVDFWLVVGFLGVGGVRTIRRVFLLVYPSEDGNGNGFCG